MTDPNRPLPPAPDLTPEEQAVSAWFQGLERVAPSDTLRARVLEGARVVPEPRAAPDRASVRWARWSGAAAAALVLVAAGWFGLQSDEAPQVNSPAVSDVGSPAAGNLPVVIEDEGLGLLHALETFDHVGVEQHGELLADWGR